MSIPDHRQSTTFIFGEVCPKIRDNVINLLFCYR